MQPHKHKHLESLNLTLISTIKQGDEWEGVCSAQKSVKYVRMPKETSLSQPSCIYRPTPQNIPVGQFIGLIACAPDALQVAPDMFGAYVSGVSPTDTCPSRLNITVGAQRLLTRAC